MSGRRIAAVVAVGLATGVLTQIGQGVLPEGLGQVANAISPWLLVAFLVGSRMPDGRWAAIAGVATLLLALVGYYGMVQLRFGYGGSTQTLVVWSTAAVVGGPVFGTLGRWWRVGDARQRAIAIGLLGAAAIAEGVYLLAILPGPAVGAGFIAAGVLVPLLVGRSWGDRRRGYVAVVPGLGLGALGYGVFLAFYGLITRL